MRLNLQLMYSTRVQQQKVVCIFLLKTNDCVVQNESMQTSAIVVDAGKKTMHQWAGPEGAAQNTRQECPRRKFAMDIKVVVLMFCLPLAAKHPGNLFASENARGIWSNPWVYLCVFSQASCLIYIIRHSKVVGLFKFAVLCSLCSTECLKRGVSSWWNSSSWRCC